MSEDGIKEGTAKELIVLLKDKEQSRKLGEIHEKINTVSETVVRIDERLISLEKNQMTPKTCNEKHSDIIKEINENIKDKAKWTRTILSGLFTAVTLVTGWIVYLSVEVFKAFAKLD